MRRNHGFGYSPSPLRQRISLSLALGASEAVLLALASLLLPAKLGGEVMVGTIGGILLVWFLAMTWGAASYTTDIAIWFTAAAAALGGVGLRDTACFVAALASSTGDAASVCANCAVNMRRASTTGILFSVLFVTLVMWVVWRYSLWRAGRH